LARLLPKVEEKRKQKKKRKSRHPPPLASNVEEMIHAYQRTNEKALTNFNGLPSPHPHVRLRDLASFCQSLHFREYRILRCRGIVVSITLETVAEEEENVVEGRRTDDKWKSISGDQRKQPALASLRKHTMRRILVTLRSTSADEDDAGDNSRQQQEQEEEEEERQQQEEEEEEEEEEPTEFVCEVALMSPTEGMPSTVPHNLYASARKKRLQAAGNLPTLMDAIMSCFTCGLRENDPVVLELMKARATSEQVQVLDRVLSGRRFHCLMEIERVLGGRREKRPALIVVKEIPV